MLSSDLNHLWRLFVLQSSRNERTIDGLGFFHAVSPELEGPAEEGSDARRSARRHMGYFNANPILASYILGAVVAMERRRKGGEGIEDSYIERIKGVLSSGLSAKGDYFFSLVLVPLGLTIACIFAMYSWYLGPVVFLALYNYYHLKMRIGGYFVGVRLGEGVGRECIGRMFGEQGFLGGCAAFSAGVFSALALVRASSYGGFRISGWGVAAIVGFWMLRRRISAVWSVIIVFMASAVYLLIF